MIYGKERKSRQHKQSHFRLVNNSLPGRWEGKGPVMNVGEGKGLLWKGGRERAARDGREGIDCYPRGFRFRYLDTFLQLVFDVFDLFDNKKYLRRS